MTLAPAYEEIRRRALELVEAGRLDPAGDREAIRQVVAGAVDEYQRRAHLGQGRALHDPRQMVDRVLRSVADYGPLTELLSRHDIEEVFIEGGRVSYLESNGRLRGLDQPVSEAENRHVVDRLLAETDRRLDASQPIVQARVLGGAARLTAVIPPIADQLSVTLRRYALRRETLTSLVELGSLTVAAASLLATTARTTSSVLVSGPPGSGKTSLLAALMQAAPAGQCLRCCEEVRELHVPLTHGSYYEARPPSLDGEGEISLRDLVKVILAMRPDRIVVGEVRGAEAFELTRAVNAGCGFACTIHANTARDALSALVNAAMMAGENVAEPVVRRIFSNSLDFVIHLDRDIEPTSDGRVRRQVMEILALVPALHDDFSTEPIFVRPRLGAAMEWTGAYPPDEVGDRLQRSLPDSVSLRDVLEGRVSLL
ncbi:MAG TPA: ATPase, T2SS/T4P/T4SS family [Acidimicrobiia bacterium]|nr:ATPase, T2SS/T4P/T4SS family [Acidimicrobiia bacterium]